MWRLTASLIACVLVGGCGGSQTTLPASAPLTDINPDPNIVEVQLVAGPATKEYLPGKVANVWAYRDGAIEGSAGTVPGPMLQAKQGDQIIVHFRNELPQPTTIHWHGLRLPANQDGSMATQTAVAAGGTFDYRFTARDAGPFWYHPHVGADEQVEKGLYAPMVVSGGTPIDVAAERYLVLDDVKLKGDGTLDDSIDPLDIMLGKQGNVLLVNGVRGARLEVAEGSRERWRLVNSANGRYFNLELAGHSFLVVGWDGGLLPAPYTVDRLLIAPGERYDVLLTFDRPPAERLTLQTLHYDRGHDIPDPGPKELLEIVYGDAASAPSPLPTNWRTLTPIPTNGTTPVRPFVLKEQESPAGATFMINDQRWPFNTPVMVKRGDIEIWEIEANPEMDHPFHLHGMFFEVLSIDGRPPTNFGWKDTVNVPKGTKLRFAVQYDPPGTWMFHCHILEHAERGMMGELMIE